MKITHLERRVAKAEAALPPAPTPARRYYFNLATLDEKLFLERVLSREAGRLAGPAPSQVDEEKAEEERALGARMLELLRRLGEALAGGDERLRAQASAHLARRASTPRAANGPDCVAQALALADEDGIAP